MRRKNMVKGLFGFIFLVLILLSTGITAYADLIAEPPDNDFYFKHYGERVEVRRNFITNGKKGSVVLWESPESHKKLTTYKNGINLLVLYTYTDKKKITWGLVEKYDEARSKKYTGWIRMDEVQVVYDEISFIEQYKKDFKKCKGEYDDYVINDSTILWTFPGSGEIQGNMKYPDGDCSIVYTYQDSDGRLWGCYVYTHTDNWKKHLDSSSSWICLSDPSNENIPKYKYTQPTATRAPARDQSINTWDRDETLVLLWLAISVGILIAATAILIHIFWKKNKINKKD